MIRPNADTIVAEMAALGARFTIIAHDRWTWSPHPEDMRVPIRRIWRGGEHRPSGAEMVSAIRRLQAEAET